MGEPDVASRIRSLYSDRSVEVPEPIENRIAIFADLDRLEALEAVEILKRRLVVGNALSHKLVQLFQFSQLLVLGHLQNAGVHARNALKEGATVEELAAITELSLISVGLPIYSKGMGIIEEILTEQK